jgi:DNA-binding response OmpR family regulator
VEGNDGCCSSASLQAPPLLPARSARVFKPRTGAQKNGFKIETRSNEAVGEKNGMNKILLVDDDVNLLKASQRRLRKMFTVDIAKGGREGLTAIAEKGPYAVIISDLMMPGMDGFEFMGNANNASPDSVFIMLTGHADLDTSLKALNEGNIFRFLTKPCKMHVLEKAIQAGVDQYNKNQQIAQVPQSTTTGKYRSKILIVDDDPEILSVFSSALNATDQYDVLTAENSQVALQLLSLMKIDIVVADREMPEMDGVALLSSIRQNAPDIILFLMTWQTTPELEQQGAELGLGGFLEKPLDMQLILKTIRKTLQAGFRGQIDGISTAAFLQMIEMDEKTCTLQVRSGERIGLLFFQKGQLISAETDRLQNEAAAIEIINWKDAAIEIEHADRKKEPRINRPLMHILMEAARRQDEMDMDK